MAKSSDLVPAILGGTPIRPEGPPPWPPADAEVLTALEAAFHDGSWGQYFGGHVERLERRLGEYFGVPHVLTCGSGTFAVELALRAIRVGVGDEVIQAAYDYGGNFLAIHAVGALPVLVDVHAANWNLTPALLEQAIGPRTRAAIVSHLHGGLVPMREVMQCCVKHGVPVVEDAAQSPGALVQGRKAGTWGDIGVLSFGGSKLLSAGRGGAILTTRADIHQRARLQVQRGNHVCPLSELQAAVLPPQLDRLDERNQNRADNVRLLCSLLDDVPGVRPFGNDAMDMQPVYYKLGLQFDADAFGLSRSHFIATMWAEGIAIDDGFRALHMGRSPNRYRAAGNLREAERAHHGALVLHHPVLLGSADDMRQVAAAFRKIAQNATRLREGIAV